MYSDASLQVASGSPPVVPPVVSTLPDSPLSATLSLPDSPLLLASVAVPVDDAVVDADALALPESPAPSSSPRPGSTQAMQGRSANKGSVNRGDTIYRRGRTAPRD
ncbi:MAG: hypothetical protein IPK74_37150 [Deltaproteobacteria bacterium]|nr:hypothetical protein [Deltaproteobacteria bacterium]